MAYGVMRTPALVIDKQVVLSGQLPTGVQLGGIPELSIPILRKEPDPFPEDS
jgi:hypothetical protein